MNEAFVVTGGGRGVGRAIAQRLARRGHVVVLDLDASALAWTDRHANAEGIAGDGTDERTLHEAVTRASRAARLAGWVNNAAIFRDAAIHNTPVADVMEVISANLGLAVAGSAAAVRRFLADGTEGAIVNVSSHQAQRAVPGALPYATAKAAIEGLTRALAVDYAPRRIRVNLTSSCDVFTPSAASEAAKTSRRLSTSFCPQNPASSREPLCRSTAVAQRWALTRRRATSRQTSPRNSRAASASGAVALSLSAHRDPATRSG